MIENGFDWKTWGKSKIELIDGLEIGDFIAKGTRGEVYSATLKRAGCPALLDVAVKVLRDYKRVLYSSDERYKRDYLLSVVRELNVLKQCAAIANGAVLPLVDAYLSEDKADLYIIMAKADGSVRSRLCSSENKQPTAMPEAEAKTVIRQLLSGLATVHNGAGYAHLDVNSANVLVLPSNSASSAASEAAAAGDALKVVLADFSFCRPLACPLNSPGIVALGYRAPELLFLGGYGGRAALIAELAKAEEDNAKAAGSFKPSYDLEKVDVFATGVLLCEMLLGKLPVTGLGEATDGEGSANPLPPPVEADVAARKQFLALFRDLIPSFDLCFWEQRYEHYKQLREAFPSTGCVEDEVPLYSFTVDDDHLADIKLKPKVAEALEDEGLLSADGIAFLRSMVAEKPEDRPSAKELLAHPWLAGGSGAATATATSSSSVAVDTLSALEYEALAEWVHDNVPLIASKTVMVQKR